MIDFDVAYDKLASLQTADEIADLFRGYGIKADRGSAQSCAVSQWLSDQTNLQVVTSYVAVQAADNIETSVSFVGGYHIKNITKAMFNFITKFDAGEYPELTRLPPSRDNTI